MRTKRTTSRKRVTLKTAERLSRAAYDFEHLAGALAAEGHESHADAIRDISSHLGKLGRSLERKLAGGTDA